MTATDSSNNSASCSFLVEVRQEIIPDVAAAVATASQDNTTSFAAGGGQCFAAQLCDTDLTLAKMQWLGFSLLSWLWFCSCFGLAATVQPTLAVRSPPSSCLITSPWANSCSSPSFERTTDCKQQSCRRQRTERAEPGMAGCSAGKQCWFA